MIAIDILREEMEKAHGDLNVWQEDWIVKAMERYAEQQETKQCHIADVSNRRELLIDFADWYKTTDFNCEGCCGSDCVNEYLKSN